MLTTLMMKRILRVCHRSDKVSKVGGLNKELPETNVGGAVMIYMAIYFGSNRKESPVHRHSRNHRCHPLIFM